MSIKKTLLAGVAGTLLAGGAMAAEPVKLTDSQMDDVAAGLSLTLGLGLTTGFTAANSTLFEVNELSTTATDEQVGFDGTVLSSSITTQAAAGTAWSQTSLSGGGLFTMGPALALGGNLSVDEVGP